MVFYCHFPDKLLADGAYVEGVTGTARSGMLKRLYRLPMDWLEEVTTSQYVFEHDENQLILNRQGRCDIGELKFHFTSLQNTFCVYPRVTPGGVSWHQH